MYISELDILKLTDEQMGNLLFKGIEDNQKNGDCILVVGSSKAVEYRLPKAVELYHKGRASKILFSGGVKWPESNLSEALEMRSEAIKHGVPEEDILVEDFSLNTLENVLGSIMILNRQFQLHNIERILVVTASFHMRRLLMTLKTYMPKSIEFIPCRADDMSTKEDNWFLSEESRVRVKDESIKVITYVKQKTMADEKIIYKI